MKSDFSNTVTDTIMYDEIGGATSKPRIITKWYNDFNSNYTLNTYITFEDVEGRSLSLSNENRRYQSYSFMPPVKTLNLQLNNFGQMYSTGSGDVKAGILKKNLKIQAWTGYQLTTAQTTTTSTDDLLTNVKHVHTQKSGSTIISDITSYTGTVATAADLNLYGSETYNDSSYSPLGYYQKTFNLVGQPLTLNITVSTGNFKLRYRVSPFSNFSGAGWSTLQTLTTGANSITLASSEDDRYLQVILRFDVDEWTDSDNMSAMSVVSEAADSTEYMVKRGVFFTDEPKYAQKVAIVGRDPFKKALETEINMPDMSAGVNIGTAIEFVLNRCNVPFDTANWNLTSTTVTVNSTIAEGLNNLSGWKHLNFLMDTLNAGNDDWRLKIEDSGDVSLKVVPTAQEADWSAHYFLNIENIQKNFNSDKQIQRITTMNKSIVVNPEATLATFSGTANNSALHMTYGTTALYVRYSVSQGTILSETNRHNTSVDFSVNSGTEYNIVLKGCSLKNALTDEIFEELGNSDNIIKSEGSTYRPINPYMNKAKARAFNSYMMGLYGDPQKEIIIDMNSNPFLELNDKLLVFDLFTYTDDLYNLTSIKETWGNPSLKDQLILKDSGIDLGRFIWDRNGLTEGINDLKYDIGLVWDQDLPIGGSDTDTYIKPIIM
jgi:hypothetical protein